jgi:hypothetical protein
MTAQPRELDIHPDVKCIVMFHFDQHPPIEIHSPLSYNALKQKVENDRKANNNHSEYENVQTRGVMLTSRNPINYRSILLDFRTVIAVNVMDVDPNKIIIPTNRILPT